MPRIELVAPAGDIEKMAFALSYGADAVYMSGRNFGLRAAADNFSYDELKAAALRTHLDCKKAYVALNIYPYDEDFNGIHEFIEYLLSIHIDGVIVSDLGLIEYIAKHFPKLNIHVSTQANVINSYTAKAYSELGVKRIVLGRELNLTRIKKIRDSIPGDMVLEAFVHGAMCLSYSGRCVLSGYFNGKSANRGECTQPCRWEYELVEKQRGEPLDIVEDSRGTYIMSSRDLNCLAFLPKLIDAGIEAFKIEGRTKSVYYVSNTVNVYRRALDAIQNGMPVPHFLTSELKKTSNRGYTTGFYLDEPLVPAGKLVSGADFVATVIEDTQAGAIVEMRNRFMSGDILEILSPTDSINDTFEVGVIEDEDGNKITDVKDVKSRVILVGIHLRPFDILRKPITKKSSKK